MGLPSQRRAGKIETADASGGDIFGKMMARTNKEQAFSYAANGVNVIG